MSAKIQKQLRYEPVTIIFLTMFTLFFHRDEPTIFSEIASRMALLSYLQVAIQITRHQALSALIFRNAATPAHNRSLTNAVRLALLRHKVAQIAIWRTSPDTFISNAAPVLDFEQIFCAPAPPQPWAPGWCLGARHAVYPARNASRRQAHPGLLVVPLDGACLVVSRT